jgi:hypothetical protein
MRTWGWASVLAAVLILGSVAPSDAGGGRHHRHHHHWRGPRVFVGFGFGPAFWHPYPYWYYPPTYVYAPPIVVQQPPIYVEQTPPPPASSAPAAPQQYWYYCEPAGAYYPNVPSCSESWIKVPARPAE